MRRGLHLILSSEAPAGDIVGRLSLNVPQMDRPLLAMRSAGGSGGRADARPGTAVVIVTYGPDDLLRCCLTSVLQQKDALPARLILVDNNPPERRCDPAIIREAIGSQLAFDLLVPATNLGYGRAVNLALDRLQEEFVLVANPDLILDPGLLRRLEDALRARPTAAAAGPLFASIDGRTPASIRARPPRLPGELAGLAGLDRIIRRRSRRPVQGTAIESVDFLSGACFLARREALAEVRGFDPRFFLYYEDADLFRRLRAEGWELLLVPGAVARHAHGATWSDPVQQQAASFQGACRYHRKHGGRSAEIAYRAGLFLLYAPRLLPGGLILRILGRRSVLTFRDRLRMLAVTVRLALSPGDDPAEAPPGEKTNGHSGGEPPLAGRERPVSFQGRGRGGSP